MRQIKILLILGDVLLAIIAVHTMYIFVSNSHAVTYTSARNILSIALFVLPLVFSSFLFDLYNYKKAFSYTLRELATMIPLAIIGSIVILSILNILIPDVTFGRLVIICSLAIFGVSQFGWRIVYKALICSPAMAQRAVVLSGGRRGMEIASLIASAKRNYILVGYHGLDQNDARGAALENTLPDKLTEMVKKELVDILIVAVRQRRGSLPLRGLLACKLEGVEVVDAPTFYEELQGKLLLEEITPGWFIFSNGFRLNTVRKHIKRISDIFFAFIGVICSLPLVLIIAIIVKIDSKGPAFILQTRMGEREKHFQMYKLRTMKADAESQTGAVWTKKDDRRITRVGRILRKFRIDEFPQFLNVLKGDMSFIGPRPERPAFAEQLKTISPYYSARHCVKPGITGWAQVMYPYGASAEDALEKLRYDLYYIKNLSFQLECTIILETIKVIFFGRGSR
jgi:sugar transferase (PEP-CTERM system associated)